MVAETHLEGAGGAERQVGKAQIVRRRHARLQDQLPASRRGPVHMRGVELARRRACALLQELVGRVVPEAFARGEGLDLLLAGRALQEAARVRLVHVHAPARVAEERAEVLALDLRQAERGALFRVETLVVPAAKARIPRAPVLAL